MSFSQAERGTWAAVASLPEERLRAAAAVIARQRPDVVGLQEKAARLGGLVAFRSTGVSRVR